MLGGVQRRYAILDDNQRLIEERLELLRRVLPALVKPRVCAAMVIGSVAEGRARDASDIDLVLVLAEGDPRRSDYDWWDAKVQPMLTDAKRFPVQPVFISRVSVRTSEPQLRRALDGGLCLWDLEGVFHDQPQARA
jgi:predicted nucleotidyltransferase